MLIAVRSIFEHVDEHMARMLSSTTDIEEIRSTLEIGLQHDARHQQLERGIPPRPDGVEAKVYFDFECCSQK